jgi:hypothetical protein
MNWPSFSYFHLLHRISINSIMGNIDFYNLARTCPRCMTTSSTDPTSFALFSVYSVMNDSAITIEIVLVIKSIEIFLD